MEIIRIIRCLSFCAVGAAAIQFIVSLWFTHIRVCLPTKFLRRRRRVGIDRHLGIDVKLSEKSAGVG
jgi:hypothetical protein